MTGKVVPLVEASVKDSVVGVTVRLTVVVVVGEPVGVIVIVCTPDGIAMLGRVEMVSVVVTAVVPLKVTLFGLKLHVAPAGSPVQLLVLKLTTVPVEVATGEIVMVVLVELPAETEAGVRPLFERLKSGVRSTAHATANLSASTEPRPVTRL